MLPASPRFGGGELLRRVPTLDPCRDLLDRDRSLPVAAGVHIRLFRQVGLDNLLESQSSRLLNPSLDRRSETASKETSPKDRRHCYHLSGRDADLPWRIKTCLSY
jgi:hypothetical protein